MFRPIHHRLTLFRFDYLTQLFKTRSFPKEVEISVGHPARTLLYYLGECSNCKNNFWELCQTSSSAAVSQSLDHNLKLKNTDHYHKQVHHTWSFLFIEVGLCLTCSSCWCPGSFCNKNTKTDLAFC